MSLKVWLPLNGNINNNGILPNEYISGSSLSYTTNYKMGSCLSSGEVYLNAEGTSKVFNNSEISIAFWIYPKSGGTTGIIFGNEDMTDTNNRKFSIFQYPTINDLHWSWMNNTSNVAFVGGILTGVLPSDKWTHVCITYKNPNGKIYINGNLVNEFTGVSNSSSFSYSTTIIHSNSTRYINDLRVYDNCISPKEVKEISKALILHYPLGNIDGFIGGRNLCNNSPTYNFMMNPYDNYAGTISYVNDDNCACGKDIVITCTTAGGGFYSYPCLPEPGTVYSWSFYAKCSVNKSGTVGCECGGQKSISLTTEWKKFECTFTANSDTYYAFTWYLNWNKGEILYIRDFKFEQSNKTSPWFPSINDMPSLVDYTLYDTSGYCNNGLIISGKEPIWSSDTMRNSGSYKFTGSQYLQPKLLWPTNSNVYELTIAGWSNYTKTSSCTEGNHIWAGGNDFIRICNGKGEAANWCYMKDKTGNFALAGGTLTEGSWQHIAVTYSYGVATIYVNGKKVNSVTRTDKYLIQGSYENYIGSYDVSTELANGYISDVRIYSTALSETDIRELYNTPTSVADNGTLMTQGEVIEQW